MTISDFGLFYHAVHGYPPFSWQERLLRTVASEGWPQTIALPTSSGKTSAIDLAVFHLALAAGKSASERTAPLRVFFVIDRRVVVDEAAEHALKLAQSLIQSKDEIVMSVAQALGTFGAKLPLDVAVLRGGMFRDNTWADEPNQPLVCVSTVDQVGSRLLFRGYQVSDQAKPVHAGLIGNDSLIIVDEAHLSQPFLDTLACIEGVQKNGANRRKIAHGVQLVRMSATIAGTAFRLDKTKDTDELLQKRLTASKPAELRSPAKGFEDELVRAAKQLSALPGVFITGVVVNTVEVARSVFEELRKSKDCEAILLTGRNRPFSSNKLWDKYKDKIAARQDRVSDGHLFVVATQTVEVGANLDFDTLVTESAPLDALRQRFGRLNRLGNRTEAQAILVRRPKEDPVYGEPTAKTWDLLLALDKVDFGVAAMDQALEGRDLRGVNTKSEQGPLIFPKYLEMWAQTNPPPDPDPDVAPFLHGASALEDADIQVVWRQDLLDDPIVKTWQNAWQDAVELAPPVSLESLPLPLGTLRRWLRGETKLNVADVEGPGKEEEPVRKDERKKAVLVWRGRSDGKPLTDVGNIRPGDVVVLPASYGGCDEFGWRPESRQAVEDIGDEANNLMAAKGLRNYRIRLDVYAGSLPKEQEQAFRALLDRVRAAREEDEEDTEAHKKIVEMLPPLPRKPRIDASGRLVTWPKSNPVENPIDPSLKPEDQDDDSAGLEREITLKDHTDGVVEHARKYASHCGLSSELVEDLVLAAKLHDLGKCDERFQVLLCGGSPTRAMRQKEPLAKSGGNQTLQERRKAQEAAQYPSGARHESSSVLLACQSGLLARATDKELVLYLIGTHHGYGRPLLPFWKEDEDETVTANLTGEKLQAGTGRELGRFDSGWIERFSRLNEKYGYWGLAYLENHLAPRRLRAIARGAKSKNRARA